MISLHKYTWWGYSKSRRLVPVVTWMSVVVALNLKFGNTLLGVIFNDTASIQVASILGFAASLIGGESAQPSLGDFENLRASRMLWLRSAHLLILILPAISVLVIAEEQISAARFASTYLAAISIMFFTRIWLNRLPFWSLPLATFSTQYLFGLDRETLKYHNWAAWFAVSEYDLLIHTCMALIFGVLWVIRIRDESGSTTQPC